MKGSENIATSFLTSSLDGMLASRLGCYTLRERACGKKARWAPIAGMDRLRKTKVLLGIVHPVVRQYTV
jgi:hypothetical protein